MKIQLQQSGWTIPGIMNKTRINENGWEGGDYRRGKRPTSHERTNVDGEFVNKMKIGAVRVHKGTGRAGENRRLLYILVCPVCESFQAVIAQLGER